MLPPNQDTISHETLIKGYPALKQISPEILLNEILEVFSNRENGTPDDINKTGCLALARKGKEAWNAWRAVFPVEGDIFDPQNHADFLNHDFRENSINFSDFHFGDCANFQGAQFGDKTDFRGAQFGNHTFFQGAQFGNHTEFQGAQFGDYTFFRGAQFGNHTFFRGAQFGNHTFFRGAQFGNHTEFQGAQFGNHTEFQGAQFGDYTYFQMSQFGDYTEFQGAQFDDYTHFQGVQFGNGANFQGTQWEQLCNFYKNETQWEKAKDWAKVKGLAPDEFRFVDFRGAVFQGQINFSNRKFKGKTNFGTVEKEFEFKKVKKDKIGKIIFNDKEKIEWEIEPDRKRSVQFGQAPLFHGCELHQDTSFDGAIFPKPTGNRDAARAYRTLKLAFNKQQATREEQDFFKREMQEEAKFVQWWKRPAYCAYGLFSDYGFSLWRPLLLWLSSIFIFAHVYPTSAHAFSYCWLWAPQCEWLTPNILGQSLLQSLPLISLEKIPNTHPNGLTALGIAAHKTISFAAFFLIGLALRNRFKIK